MLDGGDASDDWKVHLVETGLETGTGGRLHRLRRWLSDEPFFLTFGDGVSNVDLAAVEASHRRSGSLTTITAVRPPSRFGGLAFDGDRVSEFIEKPQIGEGWISGGFMLFEPGVFDYTTDRTDSLERKCSNAWLSTAAWCAPARRLLAVHGYLRERDLLEDLWQSGRAGGRRGADGRTAHGVPVVRCGWPARRRRRSGRCRWPTRIRRSMRRRPSRGFPLELAFPAAPAALVQLRHVVPPEAMFSDYLCALVVLGVDAQAPPRRWRRC